MAAGDTLMRLLDTGHTASVRGEGCTIASLCMEAEELHEGILIGVNRAGRLVHLDEMAVKYFTSILKSGVRDDEKVCRPAALPCASGITRPHPEPQYAAARRRRGAL